MRWPWQSREPEQRSLPFMSANAGGWGAGGPAPWEHMSVERAQHCIPVFAAVRFLADNIAAMAPGLGLYKLSQGEIAERQPTPSLFANPSIHGTLFDWLHRLVVSMGFQGDGIGLVTQRDRANFPTMIEWLNPINVVTMDRAIEGPGSYVDPRWYWWGRPMDPRNLLHIPWMVQPWRVRGMSPIAAFAASVNIHLSAQEYANQWFNQGGVPPGRFRNLTQKILPEDAYQIAEGYVRRLRSRQPLVYGMDWEYEPIAIKPNEAQFLETLQAKATDVAVIYGVPAEKIGGKTGDSLTYNTVEQNSIDCLTYTFRPWLTRYEYALSTCFPRGYFVRFSTDEFLRVDAKTRAEIDALSLGTVQYGWLGRDEVRASRNLPPDPHFVPPQAPAAHQGSPAAPDAPDAPKPVAGASGPTPGASSAAAPPAGGYLRDRAATNGHSTNGKTPALAR